MVVCSQYISSISGQIALQKFVRAESVQAHLCEDATASGLSGAALVVSLFVEPVFGAGCPLDLFLNGEPEGDLMLGTLRSIRTVADIPADVYAEVTTDGTRLRVQGVGGAQHLASLLHNILTSPYHWNNGSGGHVLDETGEEPTLGQVSVVLLEQLLAGMHKLHGHQFVATGLESLDDFAHQTAMDTIGLNHDKGTLHDWYFLEEGGKEGQQCYDHAAL